MARVGGSDFRFQIGIFFIESSRFVFISHKIYLLQKSPRYFIKKNKEVFQFKILNLLKSEKIIKLYDLIVS